MAKLSGHGMEVLRWDGLTKREVLMSDRTVLINRGEGWKIRGKLRAEVTSEQFVADIKAAQEKDAMTRPARQAAPHPAGL